MEMKDITPWVSWAKGEIGTKRTNKYPGNPRIIEYWKMFKMSGIKNETVSWCSAFVGASLEAVGINTNSDPKVYSKRSKDSSMYWLHWTHGYVLEEPCFGCIAVMERKGGGHVGFVLGKSEDGKYLILLGGNQGSAVSIAKFPINKFVGYIYPKGFIPKDEPLPIGEANIETRLS